MADVVQYRLERMVDELDDFERRGIFSRGEIFEIVKQRRKFEYRLKRHSPLKEDFLTYIEYEKQLDSLRFLRTKMISRDLKKKGMDKIRKSISDFSGVSRIIFIYQLAVTRYKGDLDLWFQYLEFCRERKNRRMKKVLAQVIRYHPKVPGVWIYAAAWEFGQNSNVLASRSLMQSGLRTCPSSEDLWVEYLRMELTYLNKLKARKVALGEESEESVQDGVDDENQWKDQNKELFLSFGDRVDDTVNVLENKSDGFSKPMLNVFQTVYSSAIEAIPHSLNLRKRFLDIIETTVMPNSEDFKKKLMDDMKMDFRREPEYWDWLARRQYGKPLKDVIDEDANVFHFEDAIKIYEEAMEAVPPSPTMFNLYTKFLTDAISSKEVCDNTELYSFTSNQSDAISHILMVYERAETLGCLSDDLACQHISLLLKLGRLEQAKFLAAKLCHGKLSKSVKLWAMRISIEMRCSVDNSSRTSQDGRSFVFELLKKILKKVPVSESEDLWLMGLRYFVNEKKYFDKMVDAAMTSLSRDGGSESGFSLSSAIVNFVLQTSGIHAARDVYMRFLLLPHPGIVLYKSCIELEMNLASLGGEVCLKNSRKLFEMALSSYDHDVGLWRNYYSMEIKVGGLERANAVLVRAPKALKDDILLHPCQPL